MNLSLLDRWMARWLHSKERPVVMVVDPPFDAAARGPDLVGELRRWGAVKVGTPFTQDNAWGPPLTKLLNDAANEIERLQGVAKHLPSTPALCGTGNPEAGDYAGLMETIKQNGR